MRGCYVQCSVLVHKKTKSGNKEGLLGYHWSNKENMDEVVGPEFDLEKRSIWKGRRTGRLGAGQTRGINETWPTHGENPEKAWGLWRSWGERKRS